MQQHSTQRTVNSPCSILLFPLADQGENPFLRKGVSPHATQILAAFGLVPVASPRSPKQLDVNPKGAQPRSSCWYSDPSAHMWVHHATGLRQASEWPWIDLLSQVTHSHAPGVLVAGPDLWFPVAVPQHSSWCKHPGVSIIWSTVVAAAVPCFRTLILLANYAEW